MTTDELSTCEGCHQLTRTVFGKCANCWYVKQPSAVLPEREYKSSMWSWDGDVDLVNFGLFLFSWSAGLVVLVLGLLLDIPALIFIGGGLVALRLLGTAILDSWWDGWW